MGTGQPKDKPDNSVPWWLIAATALLAVSVVGLQIAGFFPGLKKESLQGTVTIPSAGWFLARVNYIRFSDSNGNNYTASVYDGRYFISLPNNNLYRVTIGYTADRPGVVGTYQTTCDAGTLAIQDSTGIVTQDYYC